MTDGARQLRERSRLPARIPRRVARAALVLAAIALVTLLIPAGGIAALGGVSPRTTAIVVLLFAGLNFAGYLARLAVGPMRGYGVTGLLGGVISSTAVTLNFSRESRRQRELAAPLGLGVVAACTVLLPRVTIVSALLNPEVARRLLPYLAPPLLVGCGLVVAALVRAGPPATAAPVPERRDPLGLWPAVQMAVAFQVVLVALDVVQARWGAGGVLTTAALLGLTDMDALTVAMNRLGASPALTALGAQAIGIGVLSNTLLKLALTVVFGTRPFQQVASLGLVALALASGVGLWLGAALS